MVGTTEQALPIDIHTHKLLDWLIDRRHCKRDWSTKVVEIRQKIQHALQDMPAVDEITQMLTGTYIQYFHCVRIVQLLKGTEADSKNIFGRYSSTRMKDWQEILKLYEKDNVGLAETAAILIRNVQYEVPAIKKRIAKVQQVQNESVRKESEYVSAEKEGREQYRAACRLIGIQGDDVRHELLLLVDGLPQTFADICGRLAELDGAVNYYRHFIPDRDIASQSVSIFEYLRHGAGNVTVYQWRTGSAPAEIIKPPPLHLPSTSKPATDEDDEIDFGDDEAGDEIDFGGEDDGDGVVSVEVNNGSYEIVDLTGTGDVTSAPEGMSVGDGVAQGTDAQTLLENSTTRNKFIDDLTELSTFLEQRVTELQDSASSDCDFVLQALNNSLLPGSGQSGGDAGSGSGRRQMEMVGVEEVRQMLAAVTSVLGALTSVKMQHLYMISASPRYVSRVCEELEQKRRVAEKAVANQRAVREARDAAHREETALGPQLDLLVRNTRALQREIEADISRKYKERPVNIMGSINLL